MNKTFLLLAAAVIAGAFMLATGWTDLDWMMVCNKFQFGQGLQTVETWEFCPFLTVDWWLAFELSLARIIAGSLLLGFSLSEFRWRIKHG